MCFFNGFNSTYPFIHIFNCVEETELKIIYKVSPLKAFIFLDRRLLNGIMPVMLT